MDELSVVVAGITVIVPAPVVAITVVVPAPVVGITVVVPAPVVVAEEAVVVVLKL